MRGTVSQALTRTHCMKAKQCTDCVWLLLFISFWIILIIIAVFGVIYGNYLPIINGYDSFGNTCGVKDNKPFKNFPLSGTDTSNKTSLMFMTYIYFSQAVKICVEYCLKEVIFSISSIYDVHRDQNLNLCRYDFNIDILHNYYQEDYGDKLGPCPAVIIADFATVKHRCVSVDTDFKKINESYASISLHSGPFQAFFTHVYQAWPYACALTLFAFVVSTGMLSLMRWKPRNTFYATYLLALASSLSFCITLWISYFRMLTEARDVDLDLDDVKEEDKQRVRHSLVKDFRTNRAVTYVLGVVGLLIIETLFILLFLTKKEIFRVLILCEEGIKCWRQVPGLITFALSTSVAMAVFFFFWTYAILCVATASEKQIFPLGNRADYEDDPHIGLRLFEKIEYVEVASIRNCCWIYILGFLWTSEFFCGCQQFCIETAVVKWYFRQPTTQITWSLVGHHLGSVARGSFLRMFNIPRLLLTYICEESKKVTDSTTAYSIKTRLEMIERHLRVYSGIYAIAKIHRIDLYPAGRIASATLASSSADDLEDISNAVYFVFFLAKLMVANLTCLLGILILHDLDNLFFYMAPVLLSAVFAVYIAHIVLSTIEMTVNTLFVCVCEDKSINKVHGRWTEGNLTEFA